MEMGKKKRQPSKRQIVFNWLYGEDDLSQPDGWWGTTEEVEKIDKLLAALCKEDDISEVE